MSSGAFSSALYEDDLGNIRGIKVQQETLLFTSNSVSNDSASGPQTDGIPSAKVTRGAREIGLRPRFVRCAWTSAPPTNYKPGESFLVPILQPSVYASYAEGAAATYLNTDCTIQKKIPESAN